MDWRKVLWTVWGILCAIFVIGFFVFLFERMGSHSPLYINLDGVKDYNRFGAFNGYFQLLMFIVISVGFYNLTLRTVSIKH